VAQQDDLVVEVGRTAPRQEFARIPTWVLRACRGEAWLYLHLSLLATEHGKVRVSVPALAERCALSERTVRTALSRLSDAGALEIQRQVGPQGGMGPNLYILNTVPPARAATGDAGGAG
jgi:hypothetical protein